MIWKVLVAVDADNAVAAADRVDRALKRGKHPLHAVLRVTDDAGRTAWKPAQPRKVRA